jgi:hypothetical protein
MLELTSRHTFKELLATIENPPSELNPYLFVEVEKDWGPRHLFRAPYSLNEKTWLVSLPLKKEDLGKFDLRTAQPEHVIEKPSLEAFIKPAAAEAFLLVQAALDRHALQQEPAPKTAVRRARPEVTEKIPEQYFPPCAKLILGGLKDGRKRSLFSLITFLRSVGWQWQDVEGKVFEWNSKNQPPLPRNYVVGQLRWHQGQQRKISPAKCAHQQFYVSIGLCQPDRVCKSGTEKITLKNPAGYPLRVMPQFKISKDAKIKQNPRGLACASCRREFKSWRGLYAHKARSH